MLGNIARVATVRKFWVVQEKCSHENADKSNSYMVEAAGVEPASASTTPLVLHV